MSRPSPEKVANARVLVVGAGGIGCEVLKNLVLSGFETITVLDLDTIDTSNLNRQFLFRSKDVGQPKAVIAARAIQGYNPRAKIRALHANIMTPDFGKAFFREFDFVINALDNLGARRYVNRMCVQTRRPLIEGGTTGFLGQAYIILPGVTQCFECEPKAAPKSYPICTIRATPDKPVHCVVWAKELFKLLLGEMEESMLFEEEDEEEVSSVKKHLEEKEDEEATTKKYLEGVEEKEEEATAKKYLEVGSRFMSVVRERTEVVKEGGDVRGWAIRVFDAFFDAEIRKKKSMRVYAGARKEPTEVTFEGVLNEDGEESVVSSGVVPSVGYCARVFVDTLCRWMTERSDMVGSAIFDKDDALAMDVVSAASNVRMAVFHIPRQSFFTIKSIAGNIIPAIGATNAVVAGMQVLLALRLLAGDPPEALARQFDLSRNLSSTNRFLSPSRLPPPAPTCAACSPEMKFLTVDTTTVTLAALLDAIREQLDISMPSLDNGSKFVWLDDPEEHDDHDRKLRQQPLATLPGGAIVDGTTLVCADDDADDHTKRIFLDVIHRPDAAPKILDHPPSPQDRKRPRSHSPPGAPPSSKKAKE